MPGTVFINILSSLFEIYIQLDSDGPNLKKNIFDYKIYLLLELKVKFKGKNISND